MKTLKRILFFPMFCLTFYSYSQCTNMALTESVSQACIPSLVKFHVTNVPKGSKIDWTVLGQTVTSLDTFYQLFEVAGKQTITAKVFLSNGQTCQLEKKDAVEIHGLPKPKFKVSRETLCEGPDSVTLIDLTTNVKSRSWIVDGSNYNNGKQNQKHFFSTSGYKHVNLIVVDNNNCRNVTKVDSIVKIYDRPELKFNANSNGCSKVDIQFTMNPNSLTNVSRYDWKFEGGSPSTVVNQSNPKIYYADSGKYDVDISTITTNGCQYSYKFKKHIALGEKVDLKPQVSENEICLNEIVTLSEKNVRNQGKYKIDLFGPADDPTVIDRHTWTSQASDTGWIDLELSYTHNGCESRQRFNKVVRVNGVKSSFSSSDRNHCLIPHTVHLNATSNGYGTNQLSYQWYIMKSGVKLDSMTGASVTYSPKKFGEFDVFLKTNSNQGCDDEQYLNRYISVIPMKVRFNPEPIKACINQDVRMNNNTRNSTYLVSDKFKWKFYRNSDQTVIDSSDVSNPVVQFDKKGFYDVVMYGSNSIGCTDTLIAPKAVEVITPGIDYKIMNPNACVGDSITLVGKSVPQDVDFDYEWLLINPTEKDTIMVSGDSIHVSPAFSGDYEMTMFHTIFNGCKDSVTEPDEITVNTIKADLIVNNNSGCVGFEIYPELKIIDNSHEGTPGDSLTYFWSTLPSDSSDVEYPDIAKPTIRFRRPGYSTISCRVTNTSGCTVDIMSDTVYTGVKSVFDFDQDISCIHDTTVMKPQSLYLPDSLEWIVPNGFTAITSGHQILMENHHAGSYNIGLVSSKGGNCPDTMFKTLEIIEVKAQLQSNDTQLYCAPVYAQFESISEHADSLTWNFGDGTIIKTVDTKVANIYKSNSKDGVGFDLTLIASNNVGCADTLVKSNYILVNGPQPDFEVETLVGCDSLTVKFNNKSKSFVKIIMDYKDGSNLDTLLELEHTYYNLLQNGQSISFKPRMIAIDESGCIATKEIEDEITIYKGPQAVSMVDRHVEECIPFSVDIEGRADNAISLEWELDGVKYPDLNFKLPRNISGEHQLKLIAENNNCKDTIEHTIVANDNPIAAIISADTVCRDSIFSFIDNSTYVEGRQQSIWVFDGNIIGADITHLRHSPDAFGEKDLELIITDQNGCTSNVTKTLKVPAPGEMIKPIIHYITYDDGDKVDIELPRRTNTFVDNSGIYVNGQFKQAVGDRNQTDFSFNSVTSPNCVYTVLQDFCENKSEPSKQHCAIELSVIPSTGSVELNWSHYEGWDSIRRYEVHRSTDGTRYNQIAQMRPFENRFVDDGLCPITYYYKVIAVDLNSSFMSSTRVQKAEPSYVFTDDNVDIQYVSVVKNKGVEVKWDSSGYPVEGHFVVEKYDPYGIFISDYEVSGCYFLDKDAEVGNYSYTYRVFYIDHCGLKSDPARFGTSIKLVGFENNFDKNLSWNHYKDWKSGVGQYLIQSKIKGEFVTIKTVVGARNEYIDSLNYQSETGANVYRVLAISSDQQDSSYSNELTLHGPSLVEMPNAFSPNNDGLNDYFRPMGKYLDYGAHTEYTSYTYSIFNRWGQMVYHADASTAGWDGKYEGNKCKEGVYVYKLSVIGADNLVHHKSGTLTLMR